MEKAAIFLVLLISFSLISTIYLLEAFDLTGMFIGYGTPQNAEWWNISWHYRTRLEIQSTQYERVDWPVEQRMNFSDLLPSGNFDVNSVRVFEYSSGHAIYEVPSQFEPDDGFDANGNAVGTLVFMLNGTSRTVAPTLEVTKVKNEVRAAISLRQTIRRQSITAGTAR